MLKTHLYRSHIVRCWSDLMPFAFSSEFTTVVATKNGMSTYCWEQSLERDEDHVL